MRQSIGLYADDLVLFAYIVQAGSFTGAAKIVGLPKATVSRRLGKLEEQLGERLLQRSTRRLMLTEFGERMLGHAQRLSAEAAEAAALAQNSQAEPVGTLRVSLPPDFRELFLPEVIEQFNQRYPRVKLELDLSTRRIDLLAERFDIAVRAAHRLPDDSTLVARRVMVLRNGLYASPDYIKNHGAPKLPQDLINHTALALIGSAGRYEQWELTSNKKTWQGLPDKTLAANSMLLQLDLALRGLGIVGLSSAHAKADMEAGRLVQILPDWSLPATTIWCVTPGRRLLPQRTLAFIEVLKSVVQ